MALIIKELVKSFHYVNREISDPRTQEYPMISSPFPMLAVMLTYIYVVQDFGPRLMKDRKPFKLDRLIQVYDVIQIILSLWLVKRILSMGWFTTYSWTCQPVDFSDDPIAVEGTKTIYLYFIVKITDLLDTVFFVLRKRTNQVSFLHVYHHAGMLLASWVGVKYLPGGHSSFLPMLNSLVHAVMYSYYLLTSIYPEQKKNIWWKKHITQMQLVQFLILTVHFGQLFFQPKCGYPIIIALLMTPQNLFMLVMFYDFYRKAYSKEKLGQTLHKP